MMPQSQTGNDLSKVGGNCSTCAQLEREIRPNTGEKGAAGHVGQKNGALAILNAVSGNPQDRVEGFMLANGNLGLID